MHRRHVLSLFAAAAVIATMAKAAIAARVFRLFAGEFRCRREVRRADHRPCPCRLVPDLPCPGTDPAGDDR